MVDTSVPMCGVGFFSLLAQLSGILEKLPEAFSTGIGLPYDAFGPEGAIGIERGFAPWFRSLLVPMALPALLGVVERLTDKKPTRVIRGRRGHAPEESARAPAGDQAEVYAGPDHPHRAQKPAPLT